MHAPTQDELITRALDMEEGNIVEDKNYLSIEEEKRKRAHAVQATIFCPLLRRISRHETVQIPVKTQCLSKKKKQFHRPSIGELKNNISGS